MIEHSQVIDGLTQSFVGKRHSHGIMCLEVMVEQSHLYREQGQSRVHAIHKVA